MSDFKTMAESLWLTDQLHWDLTLYWLFLINIVVLLILPDGSTLGTMLSIMVLLAVVIDKVYAFGYMIDPGPYTPENCHAKIFIGTYLIRAIIFVAPLTIAGSTDEPKVRAAGIVAGISGAIYMFLRWYLEQRDIEAPDIVCLDIDVVVQSAGMLFVLARLVLRDRLRLGSVHRHIPVVVFRDLATHDVEI